VPSFKSIRAGSASSEARLRQLAPHQWCDNLDAAAAISPHAPSIAAYFRSDITEGKSGLPENVSSAVYSSCVYASKGQNPTSNAGDNVFADGTEEELASLAGDTTSGYTATLTIGISA
jgi:hypothetical protein